MDRLLRKIRSSYWLSSGSFSFLSQFSGAFFGFINFYFLLRILSKTDFGVWTLFISVATFMELIKNGFIGSALVRYSLAAEQKDLPSILSSSFLLNIIVSCFQIIMVICCSLFLSDVWDSPQLSLLFLIFVVATVLLIPITHYNSIQQANRDFKANLISNFARQFAFFLVVTIIFTFHLEIALWHLAVAHSFAIMVAAIVAYINVRNVLPGKFVYSKRWMKELARYGKFTFGTNISSMVLRNVDTWLIGGLLSASHVTIYNPALRIFNLLEVPTRSLASILFPELVSRIKKQGPAAAKEIYEKSAGALLGLLMPVVLVAFIFAEDIIYIIAGPDFDETVPILRIVLIGALIIPFNRQLGIALDALGKARTNFFFVLRNAVLNIISTYFYIQYFGVVGAAYGLLTTFILSFVINQIYVHHLLHVNILNVFRYAYGFQRQFIFFLMDFVKNLRRSNS